MIDSAMADFDIDLSASWVIGDKKSDVEVSRTAGVKGALVLTGYGEQDQNDLVHQPSIIAEHLGAVVEFIVAG